jgi:hypothetical protein
MESENQMDISFKEKSRQKTQVTNASRLSGTFRGSKKSGGCFKAAEQNYFSKQISNRYYDSSTELMH